MPSGGAIQSTRSEDRSGRNAFGRSIHATNVPVRIVAETNACASVVFPDERPPKTSVIAPRGSPPPRNASRDGTAIGKRRRSGGPTSQRTRSASGYPLATSREPTLCVASTHRYSPFFRHQARRLEFTRGRCHRRQGNRRWASDRRASPPSRRRPRPISRTRSQNQPFEHSPRRTRTANAP